MDPTYTVSASPENPTPPALVIDETGKAFLLETTKWARFFAILGFIVIACMVIAAFFVSAIYGSMLDDYNIPASMITVVYLLGALINFFPCLYLFNFSVKTKRALQSNDQFTLNLGFSNLKSYYKYIGILIIILLIFYAIAVIGITIGVSLVHH